MSIVIDSKSGDPWPANWRNRKLQQIREEVKEELIVRDEGRGIGRDGQVYTLKVEGDGENRTETAVVDPALAAKRRTGRETRLLAQSRWLEFCSKEQDLQAFIASRGKDDVHRAEAARKAAAPVEQTLKKPDAAPVSKPKPKKSKG
jgi:hypothetical protein